MEMEYNFTETEDIKTGVPVIPIKGIVVFPGSILHFDVARDKSINALSESMENDKTVFIVTQKRLTVNEPDVSEMYNIGVYAKVMQIARMSDNFVRVVIKGLQRASIVSVEGKDNRIEADIQLLDDIRIPDETRTEAMIKIIREKIEEYALLNTRLPADIFITAMDMSDPSRLCDYIADNIVREVRDKQEILECSNVEKRLLKIIKMLRHETEILAIESEINEKTKDNIEDNQREYYLKERLKAIQEELGESDNPNEEIDEYLDKISSLATTEENKEKLFKELKKLEKMMSGSPEANVVRNYLDACLELPWGTYTKDKTNITKIRSCLDKNHYGLKKIKESIIEALAVRQLNPDINGQIICLAGPPGVGKTSIAHSIADALGKNYQRIALGGIHDEAEIRGHRRTYIGAMMGRIMYAVSQAGSSNPLILLDEVDKLGNDFRGDPTSALLEVLDGEQNSTFYDHYVDMPYDLSKVMFITTANDYTAIPAPLLDRMDIIHIDSYTREEKFQIAKRHLVSKQLKKHGLSGRNFKITDEVIYDIIDSYTRESGVRNLEREISRLMNKAAVKILEGDIKVFKVTIDNIEEYLGSRKYKLDSLSQKSEVGVATGLAWTSVGGETLPVEVAVMEGNGNIELTGSLGDVMKESAHAAYTCVRTMAPKLNIDTDFYKNKDIHIHVPEGAVPKDGPSAGITMATAITSALTGLSVRRDLAMTGEITIRGRVLPIGGLKEKTMAAYRLGIKTVIIPSENRSDLDEVDDIVKKEIEFVFADNIQTVLDTALIHEQ